MKHPMHAASIPLIGVLAASLLAGCASDPDRDGCDLSSMGTAGDSIRLATAFTPSRVDAPSLAVSEDGAYLVASCTDGICRWDAAGGAYETISTKGYDSISPDLSLVARKVGCSDIALVEVDGNKELLRLQGLPNPKATDVSPVSEVAFSPDGRLVAGAGLEGDLIIWSTDDGDAVAKADLETGVAAISFSPDGKQVAVATGDGVSILDADSGEETSNVTAASGAAPVWSPDGRWLAGVDAEGSPTIWDAKGFATVESFAGFAASALAFSPDSRSLAAAGEGGDTPDTDKARLTLWTPRALDGSGKTRDLSESVSPRSNVVFGADGKTLYTASTEDGVAAWDLRTGDAAVQLDQPPMSR